MLGEGGFYIAPPEFLQALRKLCDQHGIVLVIDEIQTGFARTGRMFAIEYAGIEPDLMTMAKSLAGGFPLAAVVGKAAIMDAAAPGGLGGTYAGSPIACAAALAVLDVIESERLCERAAHRRDDGAGAARRGEDAASDRRRAQPRRDGRDGARQDGDAHRPDADLTKALVKRAAANGLVILSCGLYGNVIRFLVPLTAADEIVREGLGIAQYASLERRWTAGVSG